MSEQIVHTHKRRVGKGRHALRRRREGALYLLEKVEEPNERQQTEIETLQKRIGRSSTTTVVSAVEAALTVDG